MNPAYGSGSGERYASFFHHNPHATYSVDRRGYYTDANQRALDMTGLSLAQMRETHFSELIHPDDVHLIQDGFDRALVGESSMIEARVRPLDGSELVDVRVTAIPVVLDGEVVGVHGVTEDTTEVKQVLRQLEAANARLAEADAAKTLFLANVSHEIRTPLAAVIGATELLMEADLETGPLQFVHMVQRNSQRLLRLVNDILDFSRLEAHRVALRSKPFNVRDVLAGVAEWALPLAESRGLTLSLNVEESVPPRLVGDGLRIGQVVTNLVQNALKFTESGGVDVRVSSRAGARSLNDTTKTTETWVRFQVTDTGIGIAEGRLMDLFQPFTQADPSATRKHEGVGLGLAICRDLVDLMGGQLQTISLVGEGSTFTFSVPLAQPLEASAIR